jgi:hypothetical protein
MSSLSISNVTKFNNIFYDDIKDDELGRASVSHGAEVKFIIWYCGGNLMEQSLISVTFILAGPGPSQRTVCNIIARERKNSGATNRNTHV